MLERSFTGKNPPEEIIVNAKFNESKVLIERVFRMIKIESVSAEYRRKTLMPCFNISELLNDIKFVSVFLKLSS